MKFNFLQILIKLSKLSFYILCTICLSLGSLLASETTAQVKSVKEVRIDINLKQVSLSKALASIEKSTGYNFVVSKEKIDLQQKVDLNHSGGTVEDVLLSISKQANVRFQQINKNIDISKIREEDLAAITLVEVMTDVDISGKITDENGEGLPGASVIQKGTANGTTTDLDGNYKLNLPDNAVLVVSFVGYKTAEIPLAGRSTIDIQMELDAEQLEEVVVVGYGSVRKSDLTGAVSTVNAKDVENLPASRIDQTLQGRTPGVLITSTNGSPGARASIRIRGGNSINVDNEPLWVIDGFIVGTDFNLNTLNVNDVQSIDVLKDASAIAIYGTRGANGVILVTTKTGASLKNGSPEISINLYQGIQSMARKIKLLDGAQRAEYGIEASAFNGEADPFTDPSEYGDTDWQDVISQNGKITNVDLSVSGRSDKLNYYLSANIFDQRGIIRKSGIRRYNLRTNIDLQINPKLKAGLRMNTSFIKDDNELIDFWGMREVLTAFPVYNNDGTFNSSNLVTGGVLRNPEADLQLRNDFSLRMNILSTFYLEYEILNGLIFKSSIGPKLSWDKRNRFNSKDLPTRISANSGGGASVSQDFGWDILQENTLSYDKTLEGGHAINAVAGFTWQKQRGENFSASTSGLTVDALKYDALGAGDPLTFAISSGSNNAKQIASWLGRVNYSYKRKYLLTLAGRMDGASVYKGSNNEYAFFPSAAVAWQMIEEPFMENLGVFDNLKLRASFGSSGKESIGPYRTLATLDRGTVIFNDQQNLAIRRGRPASPDLKWETTSQFDLGLEFGFFKGRLTGEVDFYYKKTRDLLLERQIPRATGFNTRLENIGSLQNKGIELMLDAVIIDKQEFSWNTTLTVARNRSKVLDLAGVDEIVVANLEQGGPSSKLIIGEPVGVFVGIEYLGTYKDQGEIDADGNLGISQLVGGPKFRDSDGSGTINNDDHEIIGNPEPDLYGGINNTFKYKNFTLDFYFQGTIGNEIYNEFAQRAWFGRSASNMYAELVDRWTNTNPTSDIPRAGSMVAISDIRSNTQMIENGSHLRLKNVKISYSIPIKNSKSIKSLIVYGTGSNVLLFSGFRGYDPEVNRFGTDSTVRGVARAEYPNAKTFTVGVRGSF